jgi:hypothetical protein
MYAQGGLPKLTRLYSSRSKSAANLEARSMKFHNAPLEPEPLLSKCFHESSP